MKDRKPKYPGRVRLVPVDGQPGVYDIVRADEPEEAGTPINKKSLLTDETAEALGLDPENDPTPDDALYSLAGKVGDVRETLRTDLGDKWILCNGEIVPEGMYPELRELLWYNTEWRPFATKFGYNRVRPTRKPGEWVYLNFGNSSMPTTSAAVYNANTETWTTVTCPKVTTDYTYGIFGLTWDGKRYILGVMEDSSSEDYIGTMFLYVSTDLKNWTQKFSFKNSANYMQGHDLTSDGESTIVMQRGTTYYEPYVHVSFHSVNRAMTKATSLRSVSGDYSDYEMFPAPDGYWVYKFPYENDSGDALLGVALMKGSTTIVSGGSGSGHAIAFFSDKYAMTVRGVEASDDYYGTSYTAIADLTAGTYQKYDWEELLGFEYESGRHYYCNYCEYDKNNSEWIFYIRTNNFVYYAAYISEDSDPRVAANYRVVQIEALPEKAYNDQMAPDRSVLHENFIRDPNLKYLPMHDGDTYKYIHKGDDDA